MNNVNRLIILAYIIAFALHPVKSFCIVYPHKAQNIRREWMYLVSDFKCLARDLVVGIRQVVLPLNLVAIA